MTFSLLARDAETGAIGGAATTGSLCVGGWVLRGRPNAGMSASQGSAPSTFWGEGVLDLMAAGAEAASAVRQVTAADPGRAHRQLSALDLSGRTGCFTGAELIPAAGWRAFGGAVAAGNLLASDDVPAAVLEGFATAGSFSERLLAGLRAGEAAGGDSRGLLSAALLVLDPGRPPLTLRVDLADDPLAALEELHRRATTGSYAAWTRTVPVIGDEHRVETSAADKSP